MAGGNSTSHESKIGAASHAACDWNPAPPATRNAATRIPGSPVKNKATGTYSALPIQSAIFQSGQASTSFSPFAVPCTTASHAAQNGNVHTVAQKINTGKII